ncbi:hypothetical protein H0I25_05065 [Cellulophaga sp. HaHa_2_95]|uniref:hypothetical protein n=1 Tax=unclassified Cellulophaga TaxID=2634405 RepID=UPI001C4F50E2|nr:hypothetical protein [Cellulophaga sp. HaHa_2_95]QXP57165.1 hypothetical protein H0I25_05065 [Cellulophaga sp. HaHa_2_95]
MKKSKNTKEENLLCPSYLAKPGAQLYGIINSDGYIDFLKQPIAVNETFIAQANEGRNPEKRFRFAGNCAKSGCKQWTGKDCGLVGNIISIVANEVSKELQFCPIRTKCRWYAQEGEQACAQCNEVVRNIETKLVLEGS